MIFITDLLSRITYLITQYIFLSIALVLLSEEVSLSKSELRGNVLSANIKYRKTDLGKVEFDFATSKIKFLRATILFDFKKNFPIIRYYAPHFYMKIIPDSLISGLVTCRSDNLIFGKAKFQYRYLLRTRNLYVEKTELDIFLKPIGLKIGNDQKIAFIFNFSDMTFKIEQDEIKGYASVDKKQKLKGEINVAFDWVKGDLKFRLGNLLKVDFKLKELDIIKFNQRFNLDIHEILKCKSSLKYSSFNISAQIDKIIFPNKNMTDAKFNIFCIDCNINSLLFVSKFSGKEIYVMMDSKKQIWLKSNSAAKLIELFFDKEEFKKGYIDAIFTLLDPNYHHLKLSYIGDIKNFTIKKFWIPELKNPLAPIRFLRRLMDPPSKTHCSFDGFFNEQVLLNRFDINNNYSRFTMLSDIDIFEMKMNSKAFFCYKNFLTFIADRTDFKFLADRLAVEIEVDLKDKDNPKVELKKIKISPGVFIATFLQPLIV